MRIYVRQVGIVLLSVLAVLAAGLALGQETAQKPPAAVVQTPEAAKPSTPVLGDVQRLQLQVVAQRIEIAQLRAQQAQSEFDKARADLETLLKSLAVPGWTLDLSTLSYKPEEKRK